MNASSKWFVIASCLAMASLARAADQPNILWITAEDMSPTLGCYDDEFATTPNIDRLCGESVKYTHAFATAPVCSPSRSCLITGCYAPSLGTQQMRSAFPIPDSMRGFPALLRDQGYYTSNNVKTDYNTANWGKIVKASWNESSNEAHWRNRADSRQPFFSIFNLMTSHQSRTMVWPREQFVREVQSRLNADEIHDPAKAPVPPYYPDTPLIRRVIARYYDCVTAMDKEVGEILTQLDDDGLADDTIVFFYSDHGSGMPRHKRVMYDSGMHVPLLVRFPEKYRHLAPAAAGETTDRLVSFVDFGPTVLNLAGVDVPDAMQGLPFLGDNQPEPRQYVHGHRDRIDEVIDLVRSVRSDRYLYIRNYMPHLGNNQYSAWPEQGEIRHEIYRLTNRKTMTDAQWQFVAPARPVEELYDCQADRLNLNNLAESPQHRDVLEIMRAEHERHIRESRDLGFVPEIDAWKIFASSTPWDRRDEIDIESLIEAASLVGTADETPLLANLTSKNAGIRSWAATSLSACSNLSDAAQDQLLTALKDRSMSVRIAAANALARHGDLDAALPVLTSALEHDDLTTVMYAARTIELLGDDARAAIPAMRRVAARAESIRPSDTPATVVTSGDQDLAMFIGFSANGFLSRAASDEWESLFDGQTLDGWAKAEPDEVTVKDGEIHILTKRNLWLLQEATYDDFELQVEALMPAGTYNSGVGFRCSASAGKRPVGYQCEIDGRKSGMIYAIGSGWVWPKGAEETERFHKMAGDAFREGQWNTFRVRCEGDHIQVWVNDVQTADVHDDRHQRGSVGLQHHGKGDVHRFRNIRMRKL